MENLDLTQLSSENYNSLSDVIILSVSKATGVPTVKIVNADKAREATTARAIACVIMKSYDFATREIGRQLSTDPKGVRRFLYAHEENLAKKRYAKSFEMSNEFVEGYYSSNAGLQEKFNTLYVRQMELESKYQHLKELLLN